MEFNEVNKNAVTNFLAQLTKQNLSSASAGKGFADLLVASDDASEAKASPVLSNERNHKLSATTDSAKNKDKDTKNIKADNRNDKPKADKSSAKKENKPLEAREDLSVPTEVKDTNAPKETVIADSAVESVDKLVDTSISVPSVDGDVKLADSAISLDALALMGAINVINLETGEITATTGAELAAKLAAQGVEAVNLNPVAGQENVVSLTPIAPVENKTAQVTIPLEIMEKVVSPEVQVASEAIVAQQAQVSSPKATQKADAVAEVFDDNGELVSKTVAEQSSEVAELLGKDTKVKIEVTTNEENFAQRSSKDLLANAKLVDDVAEGSAKIEVSTATSVAAQTPSNSQNPANLTPVANAAPVVPQVAEVAKSVALPVQEAGSVTLSQAGAPSSEFVQAAKLEAANDSKATSFRDVYKGLSRETVDQIKVNITKSAVQGIDKIQIQLKPEDLGNIEVKLQIGKDGKLQAHIISSRPETMEALQKEMGNLEKAFNDAGFQTDEGSLSFSFREDSQANQNQERDNGLRNFIGDIFEKEANQELVSGELYTMDYDGKSGLNIRV